MGEDLSSDYLLKSDDSSTTMEPDSPLTDQEPMVTSQVPMATSQVPVATSQEPVVISQPPVVKNYVPTASDKPLNLAPLSSSNWMSWLPDRTRVWSVAMPGSHDTGSFGYARRALVPSDLNATTLVQTNESRADFRTQLNNGIRFWDMRLAKVSDRLGDNINIFHGSFYTGTSLNEALTAAREFLRDNPRETLVISLKKEQPFQQAATGEIGPADIQAYLNKFSTNLKTNNPLWVAGPNDFKTVVNRRSNVGLADLNKPGSGFELETRNPRTTPGVKLNYENLTLGDVRGKIILHMRDFGGYNSWDSGIVALDAGGYTNGVYMQDNYEGPTYAQKKADILAHAKGLYGKPDASTSKKFAWNFASATTGVTGGTAKEWWVNPATFALTINAGPASRGFMTDDSLNPFKPQRTASLKTMLSPGGEITRWNLAQKRSGANGLRGAVAGDYFLAPQAWYNDFWTNLKYSRKTRFPNLNDSRYQASDHLTKLIWQQNAIAALKLGDFSYDALTGLPVVKEGVQAKFSLQPFMDNTDLKGLGYRISRVSAQKAGLSDAQIAGIKIASADSPLSMKFNDGKKAATFTIDRTIRVASGVINNFQQVNGFTASCKPSTSGPDGYHFFKFEFTNPGTSTVIGAPYFFAVTDTLA